MKLEEQLLAEMSRRNVDFIAHHIGDDPELFKEVVELVFSGSPTLALRASWVISAVTDTYPALLVPYMKKIISRLETFGHPGIRRNLLRYMASNDIPEEMEGQLYDICSRYVISHSEPPANKVHAMQIMFNIAQKEPELKRELRLIFEGIQDHNSAALNSRVRQLMALL
jgi:hypothetical protein